MIYLDLFWGFVVVSLLAFGGGQAALPLVERLAVHDMRWITPTMFGAAVALAYVTPGPVLILATFIGHQVAGVPGGLVATLGAFAAPWALAVLTARQVTRLARHPWLERFGSAAAAAAVGMLGATVLDIGRVTIAESWSHVAISGLVLGLAAATRLHPIALLALGGALGYVLPG
jgi:chromate transporter